MEARQRTSIDAHIGSSRRRGRPGLHQRLESRARLVHPCLRVGARRDRFGAAAEGRLRLAEGWRRQQRKPAERIAAAAGPNLRLWTAAAATAARIVMARAILPILPILLAVVIAARHHRRKLGALQIVDAAARREAHRRARRVGRVAERGGHARGAVAVLDGDHVAKGHGDVVAVVGDGRRDLALQRRVAHAPSLELRHRRALDGADRGRRAICRRRGSIGIRIGALIRPIRAAQLDPQAPHSCSGALLLGGILVVRVKREQRGYLAREERGAERSPDAAA